MDLSRQFILLNGEPKTLEIASIERVLPQGYCVRFKNNGKSYNYRSDNVVWLNNPQWFFPGHCKVYIRRKPQNNIREILMFADGYKNYWRIIYNNGYVVDVGEDKIMVAVSCLEEDESKNTL